MISRLFKCLLIMFGIVICLAASRPVYSPRSMNSNTRCAACGMVVMNFAGPHAQIIWHNGQVDFYGNLQEAMPVILANKNQANIAAVYVQSFDHLTWGSYHGHWIQAQNAYYVIDSPEKRAAMGISYTPFKIEQNALVFAKKYGGRVVTYAQIDPHVVIKTQKNFHAGRWMLGLNYMYMPMGGLLSGSQNVQVQPGRGGYMSVPKTMSMHMLMLNVMYMAQRWDLMLMGNYLFKNMTSDMSMMGKQSEPTMSTQGLGDTQLLGGYSVYHTSKQTLTLSAGVSLPTGSISEHGSMGSMSDMTYGYPMQLGSGTFDPIFDVTYNYIMNAWTFSAEAKTILRLYNNSHHYSLGNYYELETSSDYSFNRWVNTYLKLQGLVWSKIKGQDPAMMKPSSSPVVDPNLQGGQLLDVFVGIQLVGSGDLANHKLIFEWGVPVIQSLNGPQMKRDWTLGLDWSWSYN